MSKEITKADDLKPGAELEDSRGVTFKVTGRDGDDITIEDDLGEETYTIAELQTSLDDGVLEIVSRASTTINEDGEEIKDYGKMDIIDAGPEDYDEDDLYIRFGDTPEGEQSYDSRNDKLEDGVSVYDAYKNDDDVWMPTGNMIQTVLVLATRDTYLVTGDKVGTGADGEPLLKNVKAVAELTSPKGVGGFIQK
jgi:hypothetical protein